MKKGSSFLNIERIFTIIKQNNEQFENSSFEILN
jgi:hypothetical protein